MSAVTPLSSAWTHEAVVSEAMVITNTVDNEDIQLDNIRNHMNIAISYLAKLLNLATVPHYGIWLTGILETALHPLGLEWVNLATPVPVAGVVPSQVIASLKRVNLPRRTPAVATSWVGNCTKYDIGELTQLDSNQNVQHRFTVGWCQNGSDLLIFTGSGIATPLKANALAPYTIAAGAPGAFAMTALRRPLLDNLVAPTNAAQAANAGNYRANIDLPDEYAELLVKMVQKKILEQRREQVPAQLDQEVNYGLSTITGALANEVNFEKMEREKVRYGNAQTNQSGGYFPNNQG